MWLTLWSDLSFNIQPFNVPLSGTAWVSRYQKKHSLTPRIYTDNKVCFELDPIKPAYNQSAGWPAHINSQCLQPTMDQYAGSLVAVPTVMQNSLNPLSTSSITTRRLLDFMAQGKITEAAHRQSVWTPPHLDYCCPHLHHPQFLCRTPFMSQAF